MSVKSTAENQRSPFSQDFTYTSLTARTIALTAGRFRPLWIAGFLLSSCFVVLTTISVAWLFLKGVGIWGVDIPAAWGFAITNFVWWIGIGHAGTLISAILLLLRQKWRNSINRFAEAMTLFAIMMAGIFPLLHLGRPHKFFYLFPYPNQLSLWPQWRSPLVWDVIAVLTYGIVSLIFWYMGLIPELATMRDFARRRFVRWLCGILSLGFSGSAKHWQRHQSVYFLLAALATPLVVSVHSIVSLDFAVAIVPGWHSTIFPPYFVAGAIFSGMAMVLTITVPLRRAFGLYDLITDWHLDAMAKVTLTAALVVAYGYLMEIYTEWYSADIFDLRRMMDRFTGPDARIFYTMMACNVVAPQLLWIRRIRISPAWLFLLSLVFNLGMWEERFDIVVSSLAHNTHLTSSLGYFAGTFWDWAMLLGSLGTFAFLFLIFVRFTPIIPTHEVRELLHELKQWHRPEHHEEFAAPPVVVTGRGDAILARFTTPEALTAAAEAARDQNFEHLDAFTPFPIESLYDAVGLEPTRMPWVMAAGGILGAASTYFLQWYAAVISYPWNVGGRPLNSWPSFVPLTFEIGVLGGSLFGFFGYIIANRFPKPFHPLSRVSTFSRASADRFFLCIAAGETLEERSARFEFLRDLGAERISEVSLS